MIEGSSFLNNGRTCANFQHSGKNLSDNDLLNNMHRGFETVSLHDFNILWLMHSGPTALLTGMIDMISVISCSGIFISEKELFNLHPL